MQTRKFGRTELSMPVFSCGGMRYQQSWKDLPLSEIEDEKQRHLENTIQAALNHGITHIETARGYGTSERQLGRLLPNLPRESFLLQTKVAPEKDPQIFRNHLEESFSRLRMQTLDLFGFHGINNHECLEAARICLPVVREFQKEGRIRFVGFSTHAPSALIETAIRTGEFDYVNLHYYWIFQANRSALLEARKQDMGVFIISPSDKGGRLYEPTETLKACTQPLSPMEFNGLFCLNHSEIHTLSIGAACPGDFDEHLSALTHWENRETLLAQAQKRLESQIEKTIGLDWWNHYADSLPDWEEVPEQVNLKIMLWLWSLDEAFEMRAYARSRYQMLGNAGHWFPGNKLQPDSIKSLQPILEKSPYASVLARRLQEAHLRFGGTEQKRLSESGD